MHFKLIFLRLKSFFGTKNNKLEDWEKDTIFN